MALKGTIFIIFIINHIAYKFDEFIVVMNRNKITQKITLNKDDDVGGSQIQVMWQCISIIIPLAII